MFDAHVYVFKKTIGTNQNGGLMSYKGGTIIVNGTIYFPFLKKVK